MKNCHFCPRSGDLWGRRWIPRVPVSLSSSCGARPKFVALASKNRTQPRDELLCKVWEDKDHLSYCITGDVAQYVQVHSNTHTNVTAQWGFTVAMLSGYTLRAIIASILPWVPWPSSTPRLGKVLHVVCMMLCQKFKSDRHWNTRWNKFRSS